MIQDGGQDQGKERWHWVYRVIPMPLLRFLLRLLLRSMFKKATIEPDFWRRYYFQAIADLTRADLECRYQLALEFDRSYREPARPRQRHRRAQGRLRLTDPGGRGAPAGLAPLTGRAFGKPADRASVQRIRAPKHPGFPGRGFCLRRVHLKRRSAPESALSSGAEAT